MGFQKTLKALDDEQRRQILIELKKGKMSAGSLSKKLNLSPSSLSYHLNQLKKADLVLEYKYKNYIFYEINTSVLDELIVWIKQFKSKS